MKLEHPCSVSDGSSLNVFEGELSADNKSDQQEGLPENVLEYEATRPAGFPEPIKPCGDDR